MTDLTLRFESQPETPKGMLDTATGRLVTDDGHGRLLRTLDEAYELHNAHVDVNVDGGTHGLPLTRALPNGAFEIAPRLAACPGRVEMLGEHSANGRATARFRVDGREVTLAYEDPYSLPQTRFEK